MKKHLLILAALMAIGLSSCNKDEDHGIPEHTVQTTQTMISASAWQPTFVTMEFRAQGTPLSMEVDTIKNISVVFTNEEMITYEQGFIPDTIPYSMISADSLLIDSLRMGIELLNDSEMRLRSKYRTDTPQFSMKGTHFTTLEFIR